MFWYLAAHSTATDEDLMNAPGFTWPREAVLAKLYLTTPTMDRRYPGGDQARESEAHLCDYDRSGMLIAQGCLDPATAGYAKWWLDHITPNQNRWGFTRWEEFLWYRGDRTALDYTRHLPPAYQARGTGWMTSRTGWGPDATQVVMMCGPTWEAHQDQAQNGFMIFRGDWLAAAARLNSHSGLHGDAASNNSITIGGNSQRASQRSARALHFADTDRYAYFAGEAGDAYDIPKYQSLVNLLDEFRRELLFLKPGHVILFDRLNGPDASLVKQWHLNTLNEPLVAGNRYQTTVGKYTLFGTTLLPREATAVKQPLYLGTKDTLSSWRVDVAAPTGQNATRFLNVLEISGAGQLAPAPVQVVATDRAGAVGAQIGSQVVVFDTTAAAAPLTYELPGSTGEQLVLDQAPGKWYEVVMRNAAGAAVQEQRVLATDQGILAFRAVLPDVRKVTVRPADSQPGSAVQR
jgi:hypothetical protein